MLKKHQTSLMSEQMCERKDRVVTRTGIGKTYHIFCVTLQGFDRHCLDFLIQN